MKWYVFYLKNVHFYLDLSERFLCHFYALLQGFFLTVLKKKFFFFFSKINFNLLKSILNLFLMILRKFYFFLFLQVFDAISSSFHNVISYDLLDKDPLLYLYNTVTDKLIAVVASGGNKNLSLCLLNMIVSILYAIENAVDDDTYKTLVDKNLSMIIKACIQSTEKHFVIDQDKPYIDFITSFFDFVIVSILFLFFLNHCFN
jgi:hypothetical protein